MRSTRWPVTISAPWERAIEASASATACEPPRATGQPTACPVSISTSATAPVGEASRRSIECAAFPAISARARGPSKRFASPSAERSPSSPKRDSASGCRVGRSGPRMAGRSLSASRTSGSMSLRYASPSAPPIDAAVTSIERSNATAVPSSSGCASASSGWTSSSPCSASGSSRRNGEASGCGWTAEQMSWTKPGSVSSAERDPPPIVSAASSTRTERPARARAMAAASPFGPAPTTTASGKQPPHAAHRGAERVERRADRRRVPDVAPLGPLALLVDAHDLGVDLGLRARRTRRPRRPACAARSGPPACGRPSSGPSRRSGPTRASAPAPGPPSRRRPRSR